MVKVCHMTSVHKRNDIRIFQKECISLAEAGFDVSLIVSDDLLDEERGGIHILSTRYVPKNRLARMRKGARAVYKKALAVNADIYHLHDPELLPYVKKLKAKGKCVVFDAHEDTQEQLKDKKWIPHFASGIISNIYGRYSGRIMHSVDAVITVTPHLVNKLKQYNSQTVMVTNYPIVSMGGAEHKETKNYICFAGGISEQWMHDIIIKAIATIDNVKYVMAGNAGEEYLNHLRSLDGWNKVKYLGIVPHDQVKAIYEGAIAGMAVNKCLQAKGVGTLGNTKLFECMEAGVPVICTNYPLWKEVVEDNCCGICVDPSDVTAVAEAIQFLIKHPKDAEEMGKNGRQAVLEIYNWDQEKKKLIQLYNDLQPIR